jgi:MFS family permease
MGDVPEAALAAEQPRAADSSAKLVLARERRTILLYASVMIAALSVTSPSVGVFVIPLSFILKNKLHLAASELAAFNIWAGLAAYFALFFGVIRDRWSPFGVGDRGFFIVFGAISAAIYVLFCFLRAGEQMLLANAIIEVVAYLFLWAAWNGLASTLGQRRAMSGEMSAAWNVWGTLATFAALILGGYFSDALERFAADKAVYVLFLTAAAAFTSITILGFWKPKAVFQDATANRDKNHDLFRDLVRLVKHWPIYPAFFIWLLWNFSPGTGTVLQYYMGDTLHASDAQWGAYNAVFSISAVPLFALYGVLSRKYSLNALIWTGAVAGVFQVVPLFFVHTASGMVWAAAVVGVLGGIATPAYMDLLIRSCPKGLEGAMMMTAWSMYALATNFGNLWGTTLYESYGGFVTANIATTIVYALIVPTLLAVPKRLLTRSDS